MAKFTFPVPSGIKTREIYGKVIIGNRNDDTVSIAFIIKFNLNDLGLLLIMTSTIKPYSSTV